MRKFLKLSFLAFFVTVVSCEDATDIIQDSELNDENAFRTLDDLESGVNGVYNAYNPDAGGDAIFFNDIFTDNLKRGWNNNGTGTEEYSFTIQPGTASAQVIYAGRYQTINFANRILRAWNRIVPNLPEEDMPRANKLKGELLAMRALAHFDVLQYYVEDYSDDNSPGIQLMNFVPEINQTVPRSTVAESFDFIRADLADADALLEPFVRNDDEPRTDKFFINNDVVKAIKARVALFEEDYILAEALAKELLEGTNGTGVDYGIVEGQEYIDVWQDTDLQSNPEVIFALARLQGDTPVAGNWYTNRPANDGQVLLEMSRQLYELYQPWDIRAHGADAHLFILQPEFIASHNRILIGKYPGNNSRGPLVNHVKLFRASEMLLIRAECEARRGAYAEATASIQQLWNARDLSTQAEGIPAPVLPTLNATTALPQILLERRKEFVFEGHRYLDLKRLGRELGIGLSRDASDCASFNTTNCALASTDYRWTLPIPSIEVNANPTIQQNTGY